METESPRDLWTEYWPESIIRRQRKILKNNNKKGFLRYLTLRLLGAETVAIELHLYRVRLDLHAQRAVLDLTFRPIRPVSGALSHAHNETTEG